MRTVKGNVRNSSAAVITMLSLARPSDVYLGTYSVEKSIAETGTYVDKRFTILDRDGMLSVEFTGADRYADKLQSNENSKESGWVGAACCESE